MSLKTSQGDIGIAMDAAKTPHTTNSFKSLADKGYFDGTKCHRLTTDGIFVLQCGDPKGDGTGGPGYTIPDENLTALGKAGDDGSVTYPAGTVAMANTGQPGTGGSQFFLVYKDTKLPPSYTPFGTMDDAGLKAVKKIAAAGGTGGAADGAPNGRHGREGGRHQGLTGRRPVARRSRPDENFGRADADSRAAGRLDWRCAGRALPAQETVDDARGANPSRHQVEEAL